MEGACLKRVEVGGVRGRLLDASLTLLRSAPVEIGRRAERRGSDGPRAATERRLSGDGVREEVRQGRWR
jgi:hypothetical protein